jgi:hypothetical protein
MPTLTDDDQKSQIDKNYERGTGAYESAGLDQLESFANDPKNHETDVKDAESNPIKFTGGKSTGRKTKGKGGRAKTFFKKKGGIIGIVTILGIGGIGVGVFGPGSLLIALTQNLTGTNDSSSKVMNRFSPQVLGRLMKDPGDDGGVCASTKKSIKCKGSRLSNKALKTLDKKGIVALDKDGNKIKLGKTGYPKGGNPAQYMIDGHKDPIPASQMKKFLVDNPKVGAKVFGAKGIFNMRAKAWAGKHIKNKFYTVFKLKKDGGVADGKNKKFANAKEKLKAANEKFKSKIPGLDKISNLNETISKKVDGKMSRAGKGGVAYTIAYGTCLASKAPMLVSAGVAGVQIMRLLPAVNDLVLGPGAKMQMSGIDQENAATPEDIDTASSILTNKTKDKDGNMTSALDSPLLLAAAGINKNKISPATYGKYIPGYDILNNPFMSGLRDAQKAAAPACSVVMNPITMYAALAVESVLTKTNPLGLLVGFAATAIVSHIVGPFVEDVIKDLGKQAIEAMAGADFFPELDGIELGHALGASALAFFPAGAMSRYIPALTTGQLAASATAEQEDIARERTMDIASLSPFDTSSKYTFLGSIVSSMRTTALANGSYGNSITSIVGNILSIPQMSISKRASAAEGLTKAQCDNADTFELTPEEGPKPAINPVGLPCTDLYSTMSYEEAENILIDKGWLDENIEVEDGATIDDLVKAKVITEDTPFYELVAGNPEAEAGEGASACTDASTGDYLFEMSGCTLKKVTGGNMYGYVKADESESEDGEVTSTYENVTSDETDDTQAYEAARVWLISYQIAQSINGEDDEEGGSNGSPAGVEIDMANMLHTRD